MQAHSSATPQCGPRAASKNELGLSTVPRGGTLKPPLLTFSIRTLVSRVTAPGNPDICFPLVPLASRALLRGTVHALSSRSGPGQRSATAGQDFGARQLPGCTQATACTSFTGCFFPFLPAADSRTQTAEARKWGTWKFTGSPKPTRATPAAPGADKEAIQAGRAATPPRRGRRPDSPNSWHRDPSPPLSARQGAPEPHGGEPAVSGHTRGPLRLLPSSTYAQPPTSQTLRSTPLCPRRPSRPQRSSRSPGHRSPEPDSPRSPAGLRARLTSDP